MKKLNLLVFVLISMLYFNCSDDKDDLIFSAESLSQTTWDGTMVVASYDDSESLEREIHLVFFSTEKGRLIDVGNGEGSDSDFKYSLSGKQIRFYDCPYFFNGTWTLIESSKDKMKLEMLSSSKMMMTVTKRY